MYSQLLYCLSITFSYASSLVMKFQGSSPQQQQDKLLETHKGAWIENMIPDVHGKESPKLPAHNYRIRGN